MELTREQKAALRIDNTDSYRAHALPKEYKPQIPLSGVRSLPTRRVRFKATGVEAVINARDFDAQIHDDPTVKAAVLADRTIAQLRELAELSKVALKDDMKKAEIVAALEAAGITG